MPHYICFGTGKERKINIIDELESDNIHTLGFPIVEKPVLDIASKTKSSLAHGYVYVQVTDQAFGCAMRATSMKRDDLLQDLEDLKKEGASLIASTPMCDVLDKYNLMAEKGVHIPQELYKFVLGAVAGCVADDISRWKQTPEEPDTEGSPLPLRASSYHDVVSQLGCASSSATASPRAEEVDPDPVGLDLEVLDELLSRPSSPCCS